ncbi:SMI1/KNR4 family protein [Streptomyces sp. NPDC001339]|uniref:SMI1/KNR4 family protein n=1 Tax=Streptomyces sp. NPDC001339 TaxID=3364563 RepID=UPI0036BF599A
MTIDLVESSWDRIDGWLRTHAPHTLASLCPPAADEEIRAAEKELNVTFPPDLVASLRRHNGVQDAAAEAAFRFPTHDRLLGVREIIEATQFLRDIAAELDEEDADGDEGFYWWHQGYVQFGSYDATSDGLTIDCRPGRDAYGAIGRFFDESGTDFGNAESLGAYLAHVADSLESGRTFQRDVPVTFNGRLIWETVDPPSSDWGSADDPLPGTATELPPLALPQTPPEPLMVGFLHGLDELGALVATLPRQRVAQAALKQMRRLAIETGLAKYTEVTAALEATQRGEIVPVDQNGPLGLRLRAVIAEATEQRDSYRRWAAEKMVEVVWGLPHRAVTGIANARSHLSVTWRDELLADLGSPSLPPIPDDLFWAVLRNPDIDARGYATRYAQDQG